MVLGKSLLSTSGSSSRGGRGLARRAGAAGSGARPLQRSCTQSGRRRCALFRDRLLTRGISTLLVLASAAAALGADATASAARRSKRRGNQPRIEATCKTAETRSLLVEATIYAVKAAQQLDRIAKVISSARQTTWDSGREKRWLGAYRSSRLKGARRLMRRAARILSSSRLKIACNRKAKKYLSASPGIYKIVLGKRWLGIPKTRADKTQKLIRAAARIAGAIRGGREYDLLGIVNSIETAKKRAAGWPHKAYRTANNLGYYAVCTAPERRGKGYCPYY